MEAALWSSEVQCRFHGETDTDKTSLINFTTETEESPNIYVLRDFK
jgi:hypothetical protein